MPNTLRQGVLDFAPGHRLQTLWGSTEAGLFTLECAGAGLLTIALFLPSVPGTLLVATALVALAGLLVLGHLGRPMRAWRVMRQWRRSWLSRGSVAVSGFLACGVALLFLQSLGHDMTGLRATLEVLLALAAAFILFYPGLVLSASPAVPFWNSALHPALSALNGLASGAAILTLLAALSPEARASAYALGALQCALLIALALATLLYVVVMRQRGGTALASVRRLLGQEGALFMGVALLLGVAAPLALAWVAIDSGAALLALAVGIICRLAGDFALRLAFLRCGMFAPVI